LREHGYVVVPNVFTAEQCAELRKSLRDDIYAWTKGRVDLDDAKTFAEWRHFFLMHSMLVQHGCLGRIPT
jgi:predicted 2-oxoglutarate/Fe(II)-dependent dioxygenase YbiX